MGVTLTIAGSLMRLDLQLLLSLDLHRVVHERGESGGHGSWAVLDEQGRKVVDRRTFIVVGHRRLGGAARSTSAQVGNPGRISEWLYGAAG
jgi:hypothetical protein